jgi:DinB superfamily
MLSNELLAKAFARNHWIIEAQTAGLTHQDSLVQVPNLNCLNWVLGHLAEGRDQVLGLLGQSPALGEEGARYRRESDPVTGEGPGVVSLERLLAVLKEGQGRISAALSALPAEALGEEQAVGERRLSLEERLHFAYFHDTYHVGQTELLRTLAGKTDKVI